MTDRDDILNQDPALSRLFDSYRPELTAPEAFTRRLDDRLAIIDAMQAYRRRQRLSLPLTLIVTFVIGVACGIGGTLLMQTLDISRLTLSPTAIPVLSITIPAIDLSALNYLIGGAIALCAGLLTNRLLSLRLFSGPTVR